MSSNIDPDRFGEKVDPSFPCDFPRHEDVIGRRVKLQPLSAAHSDALFPHLGGSDNGQLWDYMFPEPFNDRESFRSHMAKAAESRDPLFWTIVNRITQEPVGYLSFLRIDVSNRVIEIGHVIYGRSLQRSAAATEAWYLLANKAFESGYRRLEWKCHAKNEPSRRAALRYGHTFEGIFRQHVITKGHNRDTAWYSIIDKEWPNRKQALDIWLNPSNFDHNGLQKESLDSIRGQLEHRSDI